MVVWRVVGGGGRIVMPLFFHFSQFLWGIRSRTAFLGFPKSISLTLALADLLFICVSQFVVAITFIIFIFSTVLV